MWCLNETEPYAGALQQGIAAQRNEDPFLTRRRRASARRQEWDSCEDWRTVVVDVKRERAQRMPLLPALEIFGLEAPRRMWRTVVVDVKP